MLMSKISVRQASIQVVTLVLLMWCSVAAQQPGQQPEIDKKGEPEQSSGSPTTPQTAFAPAPTNAQSPAKPAEQTNTQTDASPTPQKTSPLRQSVELPDKEATTANAANAFDWQAPKPRAKGKGPFVPPAREGNNIFKGDAEEWLSDAIVRVGIGDNNESLDDATITNYINNVGNFIAFYSRAHSQNFRFMVTRNELPSAVSIGNGRILVSVGLLRIVSSEDELASILAHEIAHDAYKHVARTLTRQLYWMVGISKIQSRNEVDSAIDKLAIAYEKNKLAAFTEKLSGISRFDELKADREAFYTTYRAGYNPRAFTLVLKRIDDNAKDIFRDSASTKVKRFFLGSHPTVSYRAFSLGWEASFVKLPEPEVHYESAGFTAMKNAVARIAVPDLP